MVATLGVLVSIAWYGHWSTVVRGGLGLPAMKMNVALCFILCGAGLTMTAKRHNGAAIAFAGTVVIIAVATLIEYGSNRGVGIDQLLVADYLTPPTAYPGRMSPLTAICFLLIGVGVVLASDDGVRQWRLTPILPLASLVVAIAAVAFGGYLAGMEAAYGWGDYTRMALHTAAGLLLLGLSLILLAWDISRRRQMNLGRWLPIVGSVTLMAVVGLLAAIGLRTLQASYSARKTTYDTLVSAQALLGSLTDTQRGMRGYVLTAQPEALAIYKAGIESASHVLSKLRLITRYDAALHLEPWIVPIAPDLARVAAYAHRLIAVRDSSGLQAAADIELNGEGRDIVNKIKADIQALTDEVNRQLVDNDAQTEQHFHSTTKLLVVLSALASALLVLAHLMARRELHRRERAEVALEETSTLQRAILNSANYGIVSTSIDGTVTTFNATVARWLGYEPADIIGKTTLARWHDSDELIARAESLSKELGYEVAPGFAVLTAKLHAGVVEEHEWTLICNDGTRFPGLVSASALHDARGHLTGYLCVLSDISERKRHEGALRASEALLEQTGAVAGVGGFRVNLESREQFWTRHAFRIHGLDGTTAPTLEQLSTMFDAEVGATFEAALATAADSGQGYDIEAPMVTADGRAIWVRVVGEVEWRNGRPAFVCGSVQDITERHEAIARAQAANLAKSQFLANMSHEIRTPLNAVIGLGYLLEQTALSKEQRSYLAKIQFAGRSLLSVVNNVLDVSKIEAGEMILEEIPFDLIELAQQVGQMLMPQAQAKGIELIVRPASNLPRLVRGDPTRLGQIVTNLLNNAIKFTERGRIDLTLSCVEIATGIRLRCAVRDTGIGIPPDGVARLFTPFAQADASTTRRFGGTGLGLSIARRFVELMGGEIGVTSTLGVGSEFWVEIPVRSALESDANPLGQIARPVRILILEAKDSLQTLSSIVRPLGWLPYSVDDPNEAVTRLRSGQGDAWPDTIIIDSTLNSIDPFSFISKLRQDLSPIDLPPIILVDNDLQSYRQHKPMQQVASVVLARPLSSSSVFNAVNSALLMRDGDHRSALQATTFDQAIAQWLSGARILVVDDSEVNRIVAQRILEKQGATVTVCCNGVEAVEQLRRHPDIFDVVLMDIQMPELDGNDATKFIRNELHLGTLPIIALTAGALVSERERSIQAGMNDFLTKPLDPAVLIRVVRRLVEKKRGAPLPVGILDKEDNQTSVAAGLESVDRNFVEQMFGNDVELFTSLLGRVLREFAEFAEPMELDLSDEPARKALTAKLHKFRGSAGVIGAKTIQRLAGAAERALEEGQPAELVEAVLRQLASSITALAEDGRPLLDGVATKQAAATAKLPPPVPATEPMLTGFLELLDNHNLGAIDRFNDIAASLSIAFGSASFDRLKDAVDGLEFGQAAVIVRTNMKAEARAFL